MHGAAVSTNVRCSPGASAGESAARRVSIRRQGVTATNARGPAQPVVIGIVTVPLDVQLESTWTRSSFTEPDGPAEKTRFGVPWPLTIVPFVTLHVKVVPPPTFGTEAVAVELAQSLAGAVIVTVWFGPIVSVTLAVDGAHGGLEIVHARTRGPAPPVCVNVAFGVVAFGLNVPVPPLTTDHVPAPAAGVFPPRGWDDPRLQIVCGPPAVAVVGGGVIVTVTFATEGAHVPFEIVQARRTGPAPVACVNVAFGVVAFGRTCRCRRSRRTTLRCRSWGCCRRAPPSSRGRRSFAGRRPSRSSGAG